MIPVTDELKMILDTPTEGGLFGLVLAALSEDLRLLILVEMDEANEMIIIRVRKRP